MKTKKIILTLLCVSIIGVLYGCSLLEEQWEVVENYRLENTTTEEQTTEESTTEELKEQNKLSDFLNKEEMTLAARIDTPNGYTRVGFTKENDDSENNDKDKKTSTTETSATEETTTTQGTAGDVTTSGTTTGSTSTTEGSAVTGNLVTTELAAETATTEDITADRDNTSGVTYTIAEFMRNLDVKADGEKVLLYNGEEKEKQNSNIAIINLKLDSKNLQQKASSIMRLYAEYYWTNQDYDNMKYHLTNGFEMDYATWISGKRLTVNNNVASWYDYGSAGDNYPTLLAYLEYYFCYSGMASLESDSVAADIKDIQIGDYFTDTEKTNGAMVVDVAEDSDGNRCFLLAAGGSPGQDIEILKNPAHKDPWYYVSEISGDFETPEFKLNGDTCWHLKTTGDSETQKGE